MDPEGKFLNSDLKQPRAIVREGDRNHLHSIPSYHSQRVEVSVCSLCIFRLFAQKHDPIEIGSVLVRRRQDDIDEHMFSVYADIGISAAMPRGELCRVGARMPCGQRLFSQPLGIVSGNFLVSD